MWKLPSTLIENEEECSIRYKIIIEQILLFSVVNKLQLFFNEKLNKIK